MAGLLLQQLRSRDSARLLRYRRAQSFYEGRHFERQRNGRSNLVLNYGRAIVDKGVAYLLGRGVGFSVVPEQEGDEGARQRAEAAEAVLYRVAHDNDVATVDLQVAQNAAVLGDGVYKVLLGLDGQVRIVSIDPRTWFPRWMSGDPARLLEVSVAYQIQVADLALGGYGLSAEEARQFGGAEVDVVETWTDAMLEITVGGRVVRSGPNPYGVIPFAHVPNLPLANDTFGQSDLVDIMPLNREINERVSDQADIIRFHADPPVVFRGIEDRSDLTVGPGTVWDIPADADVKLLEWQGQPVAVQDHIERIYRSLYEIAETPRTAFGDSGRLLSGVALETELRPLIQRTMRRRAWWTRALRQRSKLVLLLADGAAHDDEITRIRVVWPPMLPRDDQVEVRNQVQLVTAGLRSHRTAMDALGTESPEEELQRVAADRDFLGEQPSTGGTGAEGEAGTAAEEAARGAQARPIRPPAPVGRPARRFVGDE